MYTCDIHSNKETVNDALYMLDRAIQMARSDKDRLLCLIVGYGSKSGHHRIKDGVIEKLNDYKSHNRIKDYILGNNLDLFDPIYLSFKYKERIPDSEKRSKNPGAIYIIL